MGERRSKVLGVVNLCGEGDLRRLERIIGRESDGEEEDSARVRAVGLRVLDAGCMGESD